MEDKIYKDIFIDPVAFFIFVTGLEPDDYQKKFLRCEDKKMALRWARQSGKSTCVAAKVVWWAFTNPNEEILIIAAYEKQARHLWLKIREYCQNEHIKSHVETTQTQAKFSNGSVIYCFPAGQGKSSAGYSPTKLILEEAAFIADEVWEQLEPSLAVTKGLLIFLGTPFGKQGFFYEAFREDSGFTTFHVKANQCPRYSPEDLKKLKETKSEFEWYTMYEAEFVDQAENAIPISLIKSNIHKKEEIYGPEEDKKYILSVDCARMGNDQTVMMIAEVDKKIVVRKIIATSKKPTTDLINRIKDYYKIYKFVNIYIDESYIGASAIDELREQNIPVMAVQFYSKAKSDLYKELNYRLGKHLISYPDNEKLVSQMADLKMTYTAQQIIKVEAPSRGHDDFPDALAILCKHMMQDEGEEEFFIRSW